MADKVSVWDLATALRRYRMPASWSTGLKA
jgi:hypothetical protein